MERVAEARSKQVFAEHIGKGGSTERITDLVAVEEPLEIRIGDVRISTTMRTPGHDFELAAGFCHAEGLLRGGSVASIRYCADAPATETEFNIVTVETAGDVPEPTPRLGTATSSCGICGAESIQQLLEHLSPLETPRRFPPDVLAAIPEKVRPLQTLFEKTGGVHAAAVCDPNGEPLIVREDIGRHNAVDKVVGRMLLDGKLPASDRCLFVSGRASFEILQKAWAAGFHAVAAVSAPSALAVALAQTANIHLTAFLRPPAMNHY